MRGREKEGEGKRARGGEGEGERGGGRCMAELCEREEGRKECVSCSFDKAVRRLLFVLFSKHLNSRWGFRGGERVGVEQTVELQ